MLWRYNHIWYYPCRWQFSQGTDNKKYFDKTASSRTFLEVIIVPVWMPFSESVKSCPSFCMFLSAPPPPFFFYPILPFFSFLLTLFRKSHPCSHVYNAPYIMKVKQLQVVKQLHYQKSQMLMVKTLQF